MLFVVCCYLILAKFKASSTDSQGGEKGREEEGEERRLVLPRFWSRFAIRRSSLLAGDPMSTVIMAMVVCVREKTRVGVGCVCPLGGWAGGGVWILRLGRGEGGGGVMEEGKRGKREKREKEIKTMAKKKKTTNRHILSLSRDAWIRNHS